MADIPLYRWLYITRGTAPSDIPSSAQGVYHVILTCAGRWIYHEGQSPEWYIHLPAQVNIINIPWGGKEDNWKDLEDWPCRGSRRLLRRPVREIFPVAELASKWFIVAILPEGSQTNRSISELYHDIFKGCSHICGIYVLKVSCRRFLATKRAQQSLFLG